MLSLAILILLSNLFLQARASPRLQTFPSKPRTFILSDISNEPDDQEALVRYLLYANEFQTRGIVAVTSTWLRNETDPDAMRTVIEAYGLVVDNLNKHVDQSNAYASADSLLSLVTSGPALYGKQALEPGVPLSPGTELLISRLNESDEPLWLLCWGGINVLAQVLQYTTKNWSAEESARLRSKLRVYTISDQDDTGIWIRTKYPEIIYIASIHGWNQYSHATWSGISGDEYYHFDQGGPNFSTVTKEWYEENIQIGLLGSAYPTYEYIAEGDAPTFLYMIQNGLGYPEKPDWGSWGGRYIRTDMGGTSNLYSDVADIVTGMDGRSYTSNQATIWRWRNAYQNDFAGRMQWTLTGNFSDANHAPIVVINGTEGPLPLYVNSTVASTITLDGSASYDPDERDSLSFEWIHYRDVSATEGNVDHDVPYVVFEPSNFTSIVQITLPPPVKVNTTAEQALHFVLAVTDNGTPSLTRYQRVIVDVKNTLLPGNPSK